VIKIREKPSLPDLHILITHSQLRSHIFQKRAFGPRRSLGRHRVSLKAWDLGSLQRHVYRNLGTQI